MTSRKRTPTVDGTARRSAAPPTSNLLLLLATVLFGISVGAGVLSGFAVAAATLALAATIGLSKRSTSKTSSPNPDSLDNRILFSVALFAVLGMIGWAPSAIGPTSALLEYLPGAVFLVLSVAAFITRRRTGMLRFAGLTLASLLAVGALGAAHIESTDDLGFDVYHLHVATAEALTNGENPWTDAVTVPDGSPNAKQDDVITGYVYPPITAVAYSLGHWLTPDARYVSLVAWLVVVAILGWAAIKKRNNRSLYSMMLLTSIPGLWLVLRAAWTEPLSLMFVAIGLAVWRRPVSSGLSVGAALASKQYFFVTGPMFLLHRDKHWVRRLAFAAGAVLVTIGPALLWDPGAFWDSAIAFHTNTEPRFDSANFVGLLALAGVEWAPPALLPLGLGLVTAVWAGIGSTTKRSFVMAAALALAVSFTVSSQAFSNYWLMVFGLCAMALLEQDEVNSPAS